MDIAEPAADPTSNAVVLVGDWNFYAEGEACFATNSASDDFSHSSPASNHQNANRWQQLLKDCTDAHANFLTHWSEQRLSACCLDRLCVSSPGWLLLNHRTDAKILGAPLLEQLCGSSDRMPLHIVFSAMSPKLAPQPPTASVGLQVSAVRTAA